MSYGQNPGAAGTPGPGASGLAEVKNPIDTAVGGLIGKQLEKTDPVGGRGFVLDLAREMDEDGKTLTVCVKPPPPCHDKDEYRKPAANRAHTLHDTASFIAFCRKYGTNEKSLVIAHGTEVKLVIDELIDRGEREIVTLEHETGIDWNRWTGILSREADQKTLLRALLMVQHTMTSTEFILNLREISSEARVVRNSALKEDGKSVAVTFEVDGAKAVGKLPKEFTITVPVLKADPETAVVSAKVKLEVVLPDRPEDSIRFMLYCDQWDRILEDRCNIELAKIRAALEPEEWTVVCGEHRIDD